MLLESFGKVQGPNAALEYMPEFAGILVRANQKDKTADIVKAYLALRAKSSHPPSGIENRRVDMALSQLAMWGEAKGYSELYQQLKKFRQTGILSAGISSPSGESRMDPELENDLAMFQGRWSWKKQDKGEVVEEMIVELQGNEATTRFLDKNGDVKAVNVSTFTLSRSGGVKVYRVHSAGRPEENGAFIYRLDPNRFVAVHGMLTNERSLPGTERQVFWRIPEE